MAEVFGVRVAGLSVQGLDGLRFDRTWALADELIEEDAWLATEGEALSGVLYELIGCGIRPEDKPFLVGLRRAVHAGRRPDRPQRVLAGLPDEVAVRIVAWLVRLERRDELHRQIPGVLVDELAAKTTALRDLAAEEGFRRGLAHSSPVLCTELGKWIADPATPPRRQVLARLARYVARAATKTSPYATFTISGLGRWSAGGQAVRTPRELSGQAVAEFDLATVWRLWEALATRPALHQAVTVRANPSLTEEDGRLWFLGAGPSEAVTSVPATPAVRELLTRAAQHPCPRLGALEEAADSPALVDRLIQIGALERRRPFPDQAADPLAELLAWIEATLPAESPDRPWLPAWLRSLHQTVANLPGAAAPDAHRDGLAAIGELTRGLLERLGDNAGPAARNLCLETAVSGHDLAVCGRDAWRPVLEDLQVLRRFLGLFDSDLALKLTTAQFFCDSYGPEQTVPFLRLYRHAHTQAPALRALLHYESIPDTARLREVQRLRRQARQMLRDAPENQRGTITVQPELVGKVASAWPPYIRPPGSISCYGQAVLHGSGGSGGLELVLNTVYSGYGRHTGRIRHLLGRAGATPPPGPAYSVAETAGAFGTNLNLRPPGAAIGIDYPFTVTPDRLRLADLYVRYDPRSGRLILIDSCGREIRPAHLGMTSELVLPPAWAFAIRVFGEPPVALPPLQGGGHGEGPVHRRPRLLMGSVILTRARWQMRAGEFPRPGKGEAEATYLVRVARWLDQHQIPRRFFARITPAAGPDPRDKNRKPLYVDAANHFLLTSFARSTPGPDDVLVLEEALPDPADAPAYGPHAHVTEYVFEIAGDPA
ncbi:lantibiotic dehydratase family protein [Actinoallomurus purpureus]|uniref:lantibiotic dehydratase n=1 Tax=Actinoallomurus purpureus TaxID=478114 RepID=UPI0020921A19|nr:lantibiotic dehydratase [Actinoallomurus purpureus]MCO6006963.1 lantibiotic dehydratase family protein [Actinoallomurus purpureus]